jgi:hypothetical protein
MRFLTGLVVSLGVLFCGYWLAGSTAVDRGAVGLFDNLRDQGWTVTYDQITTTGFPTRFDTQVTGLALTDPTGQFGWRGPSLQLFAPSYWPTTLTAILPDDQILTLLDQQLNLHSIGPSASVSVAPRASLPLEQVTAYTGPLRIISDLGWEVSLISSMAVLQASDTNPASYDLQVNGTGLALPATIIAQLDPNGQLPATVDQLQLDLGLTLDRPLDRFAGDGGGPQLVGLTLRNAQITWGDISLSATGTLTIDPTGAPQGKITVTGTNWRQMIAMAVSAGLLAPGAAPTWERGAAALAQGSDQIEAPISFQNGFMSLGPIPLGPAPRF